MKPLIVLRPEPGNSASLAAARALGLEAIAAPLFAVEPVQSPLPPGPFDAVLVGSANAFRHGGASLEGLRNLPVYAVGEATAQAARAAGFSVIATGAGGLQAVLDGLPPDVTRLLRMAGRERVLLVPPPSVTLAEQVVYAAEPLPMPPALAERLTQPCVIALHSAAAARHFASLVLNRAHLSLACIGQRVAAAAGPGWAEVCSAVTPDDPALLALAARMCQTSGGMSPPA
jgi:uroporphyrinogen-III synthase